MMSINLLSSPAKAALPNIRGSFSEIAKSDGTISKIITLVKAIILFPINLIKDAAYHVARPFQKTIVPSFKDRFIMALSVATERTKEFVGKNKSTIAKISFAALAIGGAYVGYNSRSIKTVEPTSWWTYAGIGVGILASLAAITHCFKNRTTSLPTRRRTLMGFNSERLPPFPSNRLMREGQLIAPDAPPFAGFHRGPTSFSTIKGYAEAASRAEEDFNSAVGPAAGQAFGDQSSTPQFQAFQRTLMDDQETSDEDEYLGGDQFLRTQSQTSTPDFSGDEGDDNLLENFNNPSQAQAQAQNPQVTQSTSELQVSDDESGSEEDTDIQQPKRRLSGSSHASTPQNSSDTLKAVESVQTAWNMFA